MLGHGRRKLFVLADRRARRRWRSRRCAGSMRSSTSSARSTASPPRSGAPCGRSASRRWSPTRDWMRGERAKLSRHADVAKAMDYMLKRWSVHPLPRRRPDLPDQQRRRTRAARHRSRPKGMAVRRIRSRRRAGGGDVFADRHGQAQRRRSAGLARRRARPHRRSPGVAARTSCCHGTGARHASLKPPPDRSTTPRCPPEGYSLTKA